MAASSINSRRAWSSCARKTRTAWAAFRAGEGQVFNIGSLVEIAIGELASLIKRLTGSASPIVHVPYEAVYGPSFEDTRRRLPSIARAQRVLGYAPKVFLEDGLKRTIAWWQEHHRS